MLTQIKTADTGAVQMRYFTFGTGKKTMIILPGLSVTGVMQVAPSVREAYADFCEAFTVYVFDRRENLPREYSVAQMAEDTAAVMHHLGLRQAYVFGASQGGMVALALTLRHPEAVKKLALGSTAARYTADENSAISQWVSLAKAGKSKELYLHFGAAVYPQAIFNKYKNALALLSGSVTQKDLERFVTLAEGTDRFDLTGQLGRITCPVLIIGAEDDAVLGVEATRQLIEELSGNPAAEHYIYPPGFGHAAYDTAADYKRRLLDFFLQ